MEKQLIEDGYEIEQSGDCSFVFSPAVLKIDIGSYKKGTKIDQLYINFETGQAQLTILDEAGDTKEYATFNLLLKIDDSVINILKPT